MKRKLFVLTCLLVGVVMLLAACQPAQTATSGAAQPAENEAAQPAEAAAETLPDVIKIGVNETMTGWGAPYGDMTWKGIQLANKNLPTVLGKKVELVLVDDKSEKTESAIAAQRLVEVEKVAAVLGVNSSSMAMAQNEVLDKAKIVSMGPACTNPLVTQGKPYAFRAAFIDPFQGHAAAKFAIEELNAKTGGAVGQISPWTLPWPGGLLPRLSRNTPAMRERASLLLPSRRRPRLHRSVTQIKQINPDIIFAPNEYAEEAAILQQAKQLGITSQFLAGDSADVPELVQIAGQNAEGFMYTAQFHPDAYTHPEAKEFVDGFRAEYNLEPETFSVTGYDAYTILIEAIEKAGSLDSDKIKAALEEGTFVGARGEFHFDENHNGVVGCPVIEIKDGKKTFRYLVEPE